ncbi:unnamed protein product [Adineta steineri]|uniref:Uncharacterized protein n=1 Tax=Adineta steineri TaxID=433720 RepID=A0A814U2K7_9BILA|nr:unnamed protein product [Adineta steineri]CAF1389195.1 unnamed protein product [Adineta steineri]
MKTYWWSSVNYSNIKIYYVNSENEYLNKNNNEQLHQKLLRDGYFMSNQLWNMFESCFFDLSDAAAASIDPCYQLFTLKFVDLLDDAG